MVIRALASCLYNTTIKRKPPRPGTQVSDKLSPQLTVPLQFYIDKNNINIKINIISNLGRRNWTVLKAAKWMTQFFCEFAIMTTKLPWNKSTDFFNPQILAVRLCSMMTVKTSYENVAKSQEDKRSYRALELNNGIKVKLSPWLSQQGNEFLFTSTFRFYWYQTRQLTSPRLPWTSTSDTWVTPTTCRGWPTSVSTCSSSVGQLQSQYKKIVCSEGMISK